MQVAHYCTTGFACILSRLSSDDPLYTDRLKFALYRSATADALEKIVSHTQEPWPKGYEVLAEMVRQSKKNSSFDEDRSGAVGNGPATVTQLWEAQAKRTQFAKRMLEAWLETELSTNTGREMDALLIAASPWPASQK